MKSNIYEQILNKFQEIEKDYGVEILLAVESGSRAWGFASEDSDYDVRFIYKHHLDWYLSILPGRDVIEIPIQDLMDYSGWDLRKAFFLMNKSNPVLMEWLRSPIVYNKNEEFFAPFLEISKDYFSQIASIYHYLHMAKKNFKEYLKSDFVKAKKYFYVLRPLLACRWIEKFQSSPPMEFQVLVDEFLNPNNDHLAIVRREVDNLLLVKMSGTELGEIPRIEALNQYIDDTIRHFEMTASKYDARSKPDSEKMDRVFREILKLKREP